MSEAIALVDGKPWTKIPKDLFIRPEELKVILTSFGILVHGFPSTKAIASDIN